MSRALPAFLPLLFAAGCFDVNYGDVAFTCGAGETCPAGYECRADARCHRLGSLDTTPDGGDTSPDGGRTDAAAPPPEHDTCGSPALLAEGVVASGSMAGARDDYDLACLATDGGDVVHAFSLDIDAAVLIAIQPTSPADWPIAVSLREASSCGTTAPDASCVASAPGPRLVNRPSLAAGPYSLVLDDAGSGGGEYEVRYQMRESDDTFGYWPIPTTSQTYAALPGATAISAVGDDTPHLISIGFSFPFFGATYGDVIVSANGYLSFDTTSVVSAQESYNNDCPLNSSLPDQLIAAFWEDLVPYPAEASPPSALRYRADGVAPNRTFSVEWVNFDIWESSPCQGVGCVRTGARVTQTVVLHENGDIEFRYGPREAPASSSQCGQQHLGCSATIGLRSSNGTFDADQLECNENSVAEGDVIYWVHPR